MRASDTEAMLFVEEDLESAVSPGSWFALNVIEPELEIHSSNPEICLLTPLLVEEEVDDEEELEDVEEDEALVPPADERMSWRKAFASVSLSQSEKRLE